MRGWDFILDHDASFGHYHLCPVCGKQSPTTSRICPNHEIYYVYRGTSPDDYIARIPNIRQVKETK